jgi:hypothetical protein
MRRNFGIHLALFFGSILAGCDSGEPGRLSAREIEGPEGEALVRYLVAHVPVIEPEVPKEYCVIFGRASTSTAFTKRLQDLKVPFVHGDVLTVRDPGKMIVDPSTGLPPVTLQISEIRRAGGQTCEAVAGWAFKKTFERRQYKLENVDGKWTVREGERIEGNYDPAKK